MKKVLLATHRKHFNVFGYLPIVFLFLFISASFVKTLPAGENNASKPTKEEILQKTQKLQMPFIANDGQTDERVKYYAKTFGGTVFVTKDGEIVYALPEGNEKANSCEIVTKNFGFNPFFSKEKYLNTLVNKEGCINSPKSGTLVSKKEKRGVVLKEDFSGGKIKGITGETQSVTKVSYFKGNDPSKWRSEIATYECVDLGEVYKGVDIKLRAYGSNVEKLFYLKPGADPKQIKISLSGIQPPESLFVKGEDRRPGGDVSTESPLEKGARGLSVNEQGELEAETELGTVKFTKPVAYQEIDGKRVKVEAAYVIRDRETSSVKQTDTDNGHASRTYGFTVASYDKTKDLIIDPLLASTYLGGNTSDEGYSVSIDAGGNVYVTGQTYSTGFPTTAGAYQTSNKGLYDVFVSRLDANLSGGSATPPKVITGAATSITATSAKLSGTVNPEGLSTSAWFEGSATSGSYTKKSKKKTNLTGTADKTGNFTVYGLKAGTKYYYRLCATNSAGTSYGSELSFTTLSQ